MTEKTPSPFGHGGYRPGAGRKPGSTVSPAKQKAHADYAAARARKEEALASLAELDLQTRRNELIPADAVQEHWSGMIATMRQIMLALPSRLAAVVPGCETQQEAERKERKWCLQASRVTKQPTKKANKDEEEWQHRGVVEEEEAVAPSAQTWEEALCVDGRGEMEQVDATEEVYTPPRLIVVEEVQSPEQPTSSIPPSALNLMTAAL